MKRNFLVGILLCIALSACSGTSDSDTNAENELAQSETLASTPTPTPTITVALTSTAPPTAVPAETLEQTSEPTPTLTSTPILWATATAQFNESSIREAFEQYRTALINKDGESALGIIYSLHVEWYEQLLTDALNLEYSELNSLELIQKFLILRLRHEFSQEELQSLKGEDVIIISVERGWLGLANIEQLEISEIDVGLSPGDAFVTFEGLPPSAGILFIREGGRHWKVSLYHFQRQGNEELEQLIKESRLPEDEYFSSLLEFLSDKQVDERIFNGPIE